VFIYYHWNSKDWVQDVLIPRLTAEMNKTVKTEEDFDVGSVELEELLQCIHDCKYLILTLCTEFIIDQKCRDFSIRAYSIRPHAVVPIALPPLTLYTLHGDVLFNSIVCTNGVIFWSHEPEEQELFWTQLEERLNVQPMIAPP